MDDKSVGIVALAVALLAPHLLKRQREADKAGNPELRLWGPAFSCATIGAFFPWQGIRNLSDPFHVTHPENLAVLFSVALFSGVAAALFLPWRVTINNGALEERYVFFWRRKTPLATLSSIEQKRSGTLTLMFKGGHKLGLFSLYSGLPHFRECLQTHLHKTGGQIDGL